jgi:hypothetical protein
MDQIPGVTDKMTRRNDNSVNCRAFHLFLAARILLPLVEH